VAQVALPTLLNFSMSPFLEQRVGTCFGYSTNFGWTQCQWVQMGYKICHAHYCHATFKWSISLANLKSSHGPWLFDLNSWCAQDIIFVYRDGLSKDGWTHKNFKVETPMEKLKWKAFKTSYLEGRGQGCWRGGRFFGTNENLQSIMAKLDEFTPKQDIQMVVVGLLVMK